MRGSLRFPGRGKGLKPACISGMAPSIMPLCSQGHVPNIRAWAVSNPRDGQPRSKCTQGTTKDPEKCRQLQRAPGRWTELLFLLFPSRDALLSSWSQQFGPIMVQMMQHPCMYLGDGAQGCWWCSGPASASPPSPTLHPSWRHPALPGPGTGPHPSKAPEKLSALSRRPLSAMEINLTLLPLPHPLAWLAFGTGMLLVASASSMVFRGQCKKTCSSSKFGPCFGQKVVSPRDNLPADTEVHLVLMAHLRMGQPLRVVYLGTKGP